MRNRTLPAAAALIAAGLALTACNSDTETPATSDAAPTVTETETATAEVTQTEQATETATEEAASSETTPLAIPACELMNPLAQQQMEEFGTDKFSDTVDIGPTDTSEFDKYAGPSAKELIQQNVQVQGCNYPQNMEGWVTQYVIQLPEGAADGIIQELEQDSVVESFPVDGGHGFTWEANETQQANTQASYVFIDNVWIALFVTNSEGEFEQPAIDSLRALNPQLGK